MSPGGLPFPVPMRPPDSGTNNNAVEMDSGGNGSGEGELAKEEVREEDQDVIGPDGEQVGYVPVLRINRKSKSSIYQCMSFDQQIRCRYSILRYDIDNHFFNSRVYPILFRKKRSDQEIQHKTPSMHDLEISKK